MPQEYYDPDDYTQNENNGNPNLVKDLRSQIEKANKDLRDAQQTIAQQSNAIRERTVADVLSNKGVPAKVAKLIPSDIEASESAVTKWLEDYSDLFQVTKSENQDSPQNPPNEAGGSENQTPNPDELAARRMQNALTGGTVAQPRMDELMDQVSKASPAELLAMIEASKRGGA